MHSSYLKRCQCPDVQSQDPHSSSGREHACLIPTRTDTRYTELGLQRPEPGQSLHCNVQTDLSPRKLSFPQHFIYDTDINTFKPSRCHLRAESSLNSLMEHRPVNRTQTTTKINNQHHHHQTIEKHIINLTL